MILFLVYESWPGVLRSFQNLQVKIPDSRLMTIQPNDFKSIDTVRQINPDVLVLGGWDSNLYTNFINHCRKAIKIVKWCSTITQSELSNEITRFKELLGYCQSGAINHIAMSSEYDVNVLNKLYPFIIHLPEFSVLEKMPVSGRRPSENKSVDLICAPNPRKNIFAQMSAISGLDYEIHVNYITQGYADLREFFPNEKIINHQWIASQADYLKVLSQMHLGLSVSLSESFNYTVADHMALGVPCLASTACQCLSESEEPLIIENLISMFPDQPSIMSKQIQNVMNNFDLNQELGILCKSEIKRISKIREDISINNLKGVLGL